MDKDIQFKALRQDARLSVKDAAKLFRVTEKTIKRWEKLNTPPRAAALYLMLRNGDLSHIGAIWEGFFILDDCIAANKKDFVYPHEIMAIRYLYTACGISRTGMAIPKKGNRWEIKDDLRSNVKPTGGLTRVI